MARDASWAGLSGTTPGAVILGVAALLAIVTGAQLGAWQNTGLIIIAVGAVLTTIIALRFPQLALIGVIVLTVANLPDVLIRFWGAPPITQFLIPGLGFILAYRWLLHGERPFLHGGVLAATGLFLAMVIFSALYAHDYKTVMIEFINAFKNMTIVILTLCLFRYRKSMQITMYTIVFIAFVTGLVAIFKFGVVGDIENEYGGFARVPHYGGDRLAGFLGDPNEYGAALVLMLPFAVHRASWSETLLGRFLGAAAAVLILASIMLTQSRGALLALIFGAALFGLTLERRLALRFFAVGAVIATIAAGMLSEQLIARFSTILDVAETGEATDQAVTGRLGAWTVAVKLFYDHPFLGVGAGNFNVLYPTTTIDLGIVFGSSTSSPHGLYLEVLSEHGVIGLAIYLGIIVLAARGVLRAMAVLDARCDVRGKALCAAFGVGLAAHLTAMIFLHGPEARFLWLFLTIAIAMPAIVNRRIEDLSRDASHAPGRPTPL